jgi:hypothetical protein
VGDGTAVGFGVGVVGAAELGVAELGGAVVGVVGAAAAVVGNPSASAPASPRLMCRKKVRRLSALGAVESGCRQGFTNRV